MSKAVIGSDLSDRQRIFADLVLEGEDASSAYYLAGYTGKANRIAASRLMKDDKIQRYLAARRRQLQHKSLITADRVVQEIGLAAFADLSEFGAYELNGPEDLPGLPEHLRRVIKGWKWDKDGNFVLQFVDKQQAQDQLMKYFGLYQGDAMNEKDRGAMLAATALWQFISSLHIAKGMPIEEAKRIAESNPSMVEEWGRRQGILTDGGIDVG